MAFRISDNLECAEFFFFNKNSTHGFLKFVDDESHYHIDLSGTCAADLRGKRIAVLPNPDIISDNVNLDAVKGFQPRQIGTTGEMTAARWVKYHQCTTDELINRANADELPPFQWKRGLYFEWFSQNGRVVLELIDPILHLYVSGNGDDEIWTDLPPLESEPESESLSCSNGDSASGAREFVPFGQPANRPQLDGSLFQNSNNGCLDEAENDLESYLGSLSRETDILAGLQEPPPVDDFIREMDYMEEIMEGSHDNDDRLITVLPDCDFENCTEMEAESHLKAALAIMALHNFHLHICEHYTAKDCMKLLYTDYALESHVHPGLIGSRWTTNLMTSEACATCDEEVLKDYADFQPKGNSNNTSTDYDAPF